SETREETLEPQHHQRRDTKKRSVGLLPYTGAPTCAISSYRIADAMIPLWKFETSSFSFGACAFSSGSPTPKSTDGSPSSSWNVETTGIDPPSRVNTGALPNPRSMARPAACTNGLSNDVIHGLPPCMRVKVSSTAFGVIFRTQVSNKPAILSGSWFGTSRMLIFAMATAGRTVFAPSPVNPDSMPLTSSVGRAQVRSSVV